MNESTSKNERSENGIHENRWKTIIQSSSVFFRFQPWRLSLLFFITLLQGLTQGIGLVLIIPLLGATDNFQEATSGSRWVELFQELIEKTGLDVSLTNVLIFYGVIFVWVSALSYLQSILQTAYQQEFSFETRTRLFRKLITSNWSFLNKKSKHLHLQVLTTEVPKMTMFYYYFLTLATNLIFVLTHLTLAALISPLFTLFIVVLGILVFFVLSGFLRKSASLGSGNIMAYRNMIRHIDDFWLTIKGAKVHRSEQFYFEKYQKSNRKVLDFQYKQVKNRALPQLIFSIIGLGFLIIMIFISVNYLSIAVQTLILLILLFARVFPKIKGLNNEMNMMLTNLQSVRIILDLDQQLADQEFADRKQMLLKPLEKGIAFEKVSFGYTSERMLYSDYSVVFPANSITGIFGASGKGKTTLIDLIVGLISPNKGRITWDGEDIHSGDDIAQSRRISYIPQDAFFVNGSLRENLIWDTSREVSDAEIMEIARLMQADNIIERLPHGLDSQIVNYSFHFSGGERQRLALVRALLRKPDVLILDESTSAIDYHLERAIVGEIKRLAKHTTVLFITHRHHLEQFFDQVVDLDKN